MRELGVDGLTDDRRFLVLRDPSTGEQFHAPLDDQVVEDLFASRSQRTSGPAGSAVPTDSTGSEQPMEATLTPREIQARIRRGDSPADVADATGMDLARIEPFAGPVLDEREFMAQQARRTTVRRKHATGAGLPLDALVDDGLRTRNQSPDDVAWDAFRREDGRWTVLATLPGADAPATFLYDVASRYVVPTDDVAHDLIGDLALPESPDMALADAIREEAVAASDTSETESMTAADLPIEPTGELELDLDLPDDIAAAESLLDRVEPYPAVSSLKEARDRRAQTAMSQHDDGEPTVDEDLRDHLEDTVIEHDIAVPDASSPQSKKRHERRRVPSWDEIMFGDKHD